MTLSDGTELSPALGIGAFAEKTLVAAGQCTKVDASARAAAVGLLGCGVMAGLGAALNTGNVTRGKSVAVIGCGGASGVAAIAGSALAGASPIIAVDHRLEESWPQGRWRWAPPHDRLLVDRPGRGDPGPDRRQRCGRRDRGGRPPGDLEAGVSTPATWPHRGPGRVPDAGHEDPGDPAHRCLRPRRLAEVQLYGDCLPTRDFPMLVDLYQQGRLDLDAFVSEEIGSATVEAAFEKMHHGDVLRSVVVL
jgi:S-(hydroxymethyl)mycothiol dehydrogenase